MKLVWKKLWRQKRVRFALLAIGLLFSAALFAPLLSPYDPMAVSLAERFAPAGSAHWLGCDHLGRDLATRLLYGARTSLYSVMLIILGVLGIGLLVGALSGYYGGVTDHVLMRICDFFLTFPTFILAMFLIGLFGTGLTNVIIAITLTHWAWYARIVRSLVLSLRKQPYILAAHVSGSSNLQILGRHILPSVLAQLAILSTLDIGHMMMHVSGLSFLGLGITPPQPEWGVMIADAREFIWGHSVLLAYPGAAIMLTVLSFNLLGEALRDSLDPSLSTLDSAFAEESASGLEQQEEQLAEVVNDN